MPVSCVPTAKENSRRFATPPHQWFSPILRNHERRNSKLMTRYTQIWIVLLIGRKIASSKKKHYPDLGSYVPSAWNFCACFLRRHFPEKHRNVGCFLRLLSDNVLSTEYPYHICVFHSSAGFWSTAIPTFSSPLSCFNVPQSCSQLPLHTPKPQRSTWY